jgi:dolichol-phosphate mannosyltransferase
VYQRTVHREGSQRVLTIVTPAFNEGENLPLLYPRIVDVLEKLGLRGEWIIVDDHSRDSTPQVTRALAARDARVRGLRLSRNFGSHAAIACGLDHAVGDAVVVMAADGQDPPEYIPDLVREWERGAQVVWAVREAREGERRSTVGSARLYYWLMRRTGALREMPATGADFLLLDGIAVDAVRRFHERHVSLLALILWMGFRQASIGYVKEARAQGRSGWTTSKRIKLFLDSVTGFTFFPIRLMSYIGFAVASLGFLYAAIVVVNALSGRLIQGWSSLMVVTLILGGLQMLMLGVLGEYLWRSLDEGRRRPRYLVESTVGAPTAILAEDARE